MKLTAFISAAALLACICAGAQEKGHASSVKALSGVSSTTKTSDAKKGAGTGGYSQAAADRWHATQMGAATHKVGGSEAGEVHKTKTGVEGVSVKQHKGWVYTGHVRRPHTDAK